MIFTPRALLLVCWMLVVSGFAGDRELWTTSRITGIPGKPLSHRLERVLPDVSFTNPLDLDFSKELNRWFVGEQGGKVFTFDPDGRRKAVAADFGPVQGREGTFYAFTFDPGFSSNRFIYVCYALKSDLPEGTRVSRFKVRLDGQPEAGPVIDLDTEEILITWVSGGHNGCCLKFGTDGYLYISTGDAAGPNPPDPLKTGQDVTDLLSSILRIDVHKRDSGKNYAVPADNPFVGHAKARPEIWAYGFRNPWRMGFDRKTGDLWVGDVGWELWELVFKVERGGNYGWSVVEGRQPVLPNDPRGPTPILPPTKDHPHSEAASITGGIVYYGSRYPELAGAFIYGDWETGKIWGIRANKEGVTWFEELADSATRIIAFAEDANGEIIVLDYNGGIYSLEPNPAAQLPQAFPMKLSETGLFQSVPEQKPSPGVMPFEINAEMWSDHATADRFLGLPFDASVNAAERPWKFGSNSVLAKTLSLEMEAGKPASRKRIETQILHFTGDGWGAYSYRWNGEQTDAMLVGPAGADEIIQVADASVVGGIRRQPWRFSSQAECLRCHNSWCGTALAFQPEQINRSVDGENQIRRFESLGLIEPKMRNRVHALVSPNDTAGDLAARARSYLHVNCSHCHRDNAGGSVPSVMNFEVAIEKAHMLNARPILGDLGLEDGKVISPGKPFSSVLLFRASASGRSRMPYLTSELVDDRGIALLREWIETLGENEPDAKLAAVMTELSGSEPATADRIKGYLATTSSALRLAHALADSSASLKVRERVGREAVLSVNPLVKELFERFLPAEMQTSGRPTASRDEVLALKGDASRGAVLLADATRLSCLQCHQLGSAGRKFGPELKQGKKSRAEILDAILDPSRQIAPEYVLQTVDLEDDEQISGIVLERTASEVIVRDASANDHHLPVSKVRSIRRQEVSAMPEGLLAGLSAQEIADLVEAITSVAETAGSGEKSGR